MIKPQANAGKLPLTFRQQELRMLVDAEGTGVFQQLIPSAAEAISDQAELVRMYTKGVDYCTTLETDVTFPTDVKMEIACVRDLYDAIWDWSNYFEMSKTLGAANMAMWVEANSMDGESPRKTALLDLVPTRAEQQKKVLSRELSNYIVERISWRLMVRDPILPGLVKHQLSQIEIRHRRPAGYSHCRLLVRRRRGLGVVRVVSKSPFRHLRQPSQLEAAGQVASQCRRRMVYAHRQQSQGRIDAQGEQHEGQSSQK